MSVSFKKKIQQDFGRAAQTYDNYAILQRKVSDKLFAMYRIGDASILDIGCGTGYFHELLRKNKIYLPLVQVDLSQKMCAIAASYASPPEYGATYTCATDMHNLAFADNSFSSIFSSMTMQWSEELQNVLSEVKRILINNGTFAFSIVANGSLNELREAFLLAGLNPPIHNFASRNEIETIFNQAGFYSYETHSEAISMFYKDIYQLLYAIKNVGASYKGKQHNSLRGKNHFLEVEKIYLDKFTNSEGLKASWNIVYVTGKK